ncbi:MAG: DNA polymerase I [Chloroflexota bacterium]
MKTSLLLLVDGNALVHRAFHALPPLTVPRTGQMVNAVYGFASMLLKVLSELRPTHCAVAFDKGRSFRHGLFEQYKVQRKKAPEELSSQFPLVHQVVEAFGMPAFEVEGFEADDVLGTLSRQASEQGVDVVILTGDADAMQLVSPLVKVMVPGRSFGDTVVYDVSRVQERYGVGPEQVTDLKGLMGDPSDNIPGIPGVGEKTAARLVQEFGSVEGLYQRVDGVSPARLQQLLKEHEAEARHSKELVTIARDVPVQLDLHACGAGAYDRDRLLELFRELGFVSLLPRLSQAFARRPEARTAPVPAGEHHTVRTTEGMERLLARLSEANELAIEVVGTEASAMSAGVVGIGLCPSHGESYYLPVGHAGLEQQLPLRQALEGLRRVLEDGRMAKVGYDIKYTALVLARHGLELRNLSFDTMVAAHLMGEKSLGLKALAFSKLGVELTPLSELLGKGAKAVSPGALAVEQASECVCTSVELTLRLREALEAELRREELGRLFSEVEMPLVPVLLHMERSGVALDTGLLWEMSRAMGEDLKRLEEEAYRNVGHVFNLNSSQQLSRVLYEELRLPRSRRTKGGYSTEAAVLEELRGMHPVVDNILEYRQLAKLKSTYLDALPALVNPETGRLHTSFNQTGTTTGRLSSSDPNLQNIPVRGELGRRIRHAFVAPEGKNLLAGDYSQIDLRVLAHLSQDPALMGAFQHDEDIHAATASLVFGVPMGEVTPDMRRVAKTVNFGVVYGMSEYGLEQATDLTREQAAEFIKAYFEKYPRVREYLESTKGHAAGKGYVQTLLGRRRYIPEVNSPNRQVKEAAMRMAINMPVQGTSADIIKVAMVELYRRMQLRGLESRMVLQVHDELIFEVPQDEMEEVKSLVLEVMPRALQLSVPLKVDVKVGRNWGVME